jgi:hypothetical protein
MIRETMIAWQDGENADANVIVEVRNISSSAIDLGEDFQDYNILDSGGNGVASGSLTSAYPYEVAPRALGYLIGQSMVSGGVDATTMVHVTTTTAFRKATLKDILLTVSDTTNRPGPDKTTGASTSGMVTNASKITVEEVGVAAFYYDTAGNLLGYSVGGPSNLKSSQTKAFVTDVDTPTLTYAAIARTVVVADSFCRTGPCLP